jgi:hypothetical protein
LSLAVTGRPRRIAAAERFVEDTGQFAGLLLLRQAERRLGACRRLAAAMPDRRDPDRGREAALVVMRVLARTGDSSADDVARAVGYENPAFFRKLFKRSTRLTARYFAKSLVASRR